MKNSLPCKEHCAVTGFIQTPVFFMFRTKTNGFQVMDIGLFCGLTIIGISFRLTVYRGLIASMGPIWRICYLIVLCFVFGCLSVFVCSFFGKFSNSTAVNALEFFYLRTKPKSVKNCVVFGHSCFDVVHQHGCEVLLVFLKSTVSCKMVSSMIWFETSCV